MKATELTSQDYNAYYKGYIDLLGDISLLPALENGKKKFKDLIAVIPDSKLNYAYATEKWTVAEVLVHIIDTERIFQYRALRFSRLDATPLPGFEQDDYVLESYANQRTKEDILREFLIVREASINFFSLLSNDVLKRTGTASGLPWSVAALGLVISGHQRHHFNIIKERYLV